MTPTYRPLGRSGLQISPVCLGTMNFGTDPAAPCDEASAREIVHAFLDAGHTLIDVADTYQGGAAEEIVGRAVATRRDDVVLATKAAAPHAPGPNRRGLSRLHLTRALEASLRRLGTDHIDLYQCHLPDPGTPPEETMATLDGFVRAGKVRYLGCSNFSAADVVAAQWAAERIGGTGLISLQSNYSLLARDLEAEILPVCARQGLGVLTYSPLGSGVLAGRYTRAGTPPPGSRLAEWAAMTTPAARSYVDAVLADRHFDIAEQVAELAGRLGSTPAAVALSWVYGRPGVDAVVIGPRSRAHLDDALAALDRPLPADARRLLDDATADLVPDPITGRFGARHRVA